MSLTIALITLMDDLWQEQDEDDASLLPPYLSAAFDADY